MANNQFGTNRQRRSSESSGSSGTKRGQDFQKESSAGLPWKLMLFSLILFLFSVFIFLGLRYGYSTYLEGQRDEVDQELEGLATRLGPGEQEDFLTTYSQMANLDEILSSRLKMRRVFAFLESNTLPLVHYGGAQYSREETAISLVGTASSLNTLVEQLSIFEGNANVESVSVDSINVSEEGNANFNLVLELNSSFLN